jgi:hypothetical protein
VEFDDSCKYDFNSVDNYDVNKLVGVAFGDVHQNSIRVGWVDTGKTIRLFVYHYNNGHRFTNPLCYVKRNERQYIKIEWRNEYAVVTVNEHEFKYYTGITAADIAAHTNWLCFPYFGGNRTAPQTMKIKIQWLTH